MANPALKVVGFFLGLFGWIAIMIAASTNDWVTKCKYGFNTCKKMDELESKGPWAVCVISTALYHCETLTQILDLPAYVQATRALMIIGSILGLPAVLVVIMSLPCIRFGNDHQSTKNKQAILGGILLLVVSLCGMVSTIWFPIGSHRDIGLMSFGYSLYTGWVGSLFSFIGGSILTCSFDSSPSRPYQENNHYYYSKQGGGHLPTSASTNHAKSAHV